jgi:hypothetical protein
MSNEHKLEQNQGKPDGVNARKLVEQFVCVLAKKVGRDSDYAKGLEVKAEEFGRVKNDDAVIGVHGRLKALRGIESGSSKFASDIQKMLDDSGAGDVFIPWSDFTGKETPLQIVEEVLAPSHEKKQKSDRYISNQAGFVALRYLIEKDSQGLYVYPRMDMIADKVLRPDRRSKKDIDTARTLVSVARDMEIKAIEREMQLRREQGKTTDLIDDLYIGRFDKTRGDKQEYYRYASDNFGQMTPQDFVNKVLKRPIERSPKMGGHLKVQKNETDMNTNPKEFLNRPEIPGMEMILSVKLRNPGIINNIQGDVLDGKDVYTVAGRNGWRYNDVGGTNEVLAESCRDANRSRGGRDITDVERRTIDGLIINKLIPAVTSRANKREPWNKVIDNERNPYQAIKLLNAIAGSISGRADLAAYLTSALYPKDNGQPLSGMECYEK